MKHLEGAHRIIRTGARAKPRASLISSRLTLTKKIRQIKSLVSSSWLKSFTAVLWAVGLLTLLTTRTWSMSVGPMRCSVTLSTESMASRSRPLSTLVMAELQSKLSLLRMSGMLASLPLSKNSAMTVEQLNRLTPRERAELHRLLEQRERERVTPKLEAFRQPARIKGCRGGRGAGAKSWSVDSLLIQEANYKKLHVVCLREVQLTLEESVWKLTRDTIQRLRYPGWVITKEYIDCPRTGSHFIFRGISDLRADQVKSLEDFDRAWIEEAQSVSEHSLDILFPTMRKPGSEIWFTMNPEEEVDPIVARTWGSKRTDMILVDLEPGLVDNPYWTKELQDEMDEDFARDPLLAEHIWKGMPRAQGAMAVMSRVKIRSAMERNLPPDFTAERSLGIDVARFGDDRSVICDRQGMKVAPLKVFQGADTQLLARTAWDLIDRDPSIMIKVDDDGVGGGVSDKLRDMGASVTMVHNGGKPRNQKLYTTCADEQWFTFPIDYVDLPDDRELAQELGGRQFKYTTDDRRKVESKADFKDRYKRSPDKADAVLLAFYEGHGAIDKETGSMMASRRQLRRRA